jgi:hypothetical protein
MWRVSDCADYREHQGKYVVSDVLLGCGIVREAKHTSAWISQNVPVALYMSKLMPLSLHCQKSLHSSTDMPLSLFTPKRLPKRAHTPAPA